MTTQLALTRAQKAAAILVAMGKPSASRLLKFFKQEELKALIEAARLLRTIPQADLERIVAEFESEFTEGAGLLDSADKMDTILNESLSPEEVDAIMRGKQPAPPPPGPAPIWPDLERLEPSRLGTFLTNEHPQTSAMVLSNMAAPASAKVLLTLDKTLRSEILKRMVTMGEVPEKASAIVENQLRSGVLSETSAKDTTAGQARVADVLNEMDKSQMDETMKDLEAAGTPDLDGIYVTWAEPAEGVLAALRQAGNTHTKIVTLDLSEPVGLDMVKGGNVTALVADKAYELGSAMATAAAYGLLGKEAPAFVVAPAITVQKDNVVDGWKASLNREPPQSILDAIK